MPRDPGGMSFVDQHFDPDLDRWRSILEMFISGKRWQKETESENDRKNKKKKADPADQQRRKTESFFPTKLSLSKCSCGGRSHQIRGDVFQTCPWCPYAPTIGPRCSNPLKWAPLLVSPLPRGCLLFFWKILIIIVFCHGQSISGWFLP